MTIELNGLDEFKEQLAEVRRKYPDEAEKELRKLGNTLKKKAVAGTPEGPTGKLKKSYHLSQTKQTGDTLYIEFNNSSPHYHLIERGHVIKASKKSEVKGFVPGVHMVEKATAELNEEMPGDVREWLDKLTKELG